MICWALGDIYVHKSTQQTGITMVTAVSIHGGPTVVPRLCADGSSQVCCILADEETGGLERSV